jgi:hypothetical protein
MVIEMRFLPDLTPIDASEHELNVLYQLTTHITFDGDTEKMLKRLTEYLNSLPPDDRKLAKTIVWLTLSQALRCYENR